MSKKEKTVVNEEKLQIYNGIIANNPLSIEGIKKYKVFLWLSWIHRIKRKIKFRNNSRKRERFLTR